MKNYYNKSMTYKKDTIFMKKLLESVLTINKS